MNNEYSLLSQCPPPRTLGVALAHCFAACKISNAVRQATLNRVYRDAPDREQLRCRAEMALMRAAKRGELHTEVA